jgi:hypothetical protein
MSEHEGDSSMLENHGKNSGAGMEDGSSVIVAVVSAIGGGLVGSHSLWGLKSYNWSEQLPDGF